MQDITEVPYIPLHERLRDQAVIALLRSQYEYASELCRMADEIELMTEQQHAVIN